VLLICYILEVLETGTEFGLPRGYDESVILYLPAVMEGSQNRHHFDVRLLTLMIKTSQRSFAFVTLGVLQPP
jgi:hypothetical protein